LYYVRCCPTAVCDVTTGALGVVWFVLWMLFASESPSQHGRINSAERQYIIDTLMTEAVNSQQVGAPSDLYLVYYDASGKGFLFRPDQGRFYVGAGGGAVPQIHLLLPPLDSTPNSKAS